MKKKNSEKVVVRTVTVDGRELTHIGTQSGIELYQDDKAAENTLYGLKDYKVLFTVTAESLTEVGHTVEFTMNTIDDESNKESDDD